MKKISIIATVAMATAMTFVACNAKTTSTNNTATDSPEVAAEEPASAPAVIELSSNDILSFEAPIPSPVVVDFWADWCGPCRQFSPVFHSVAERYRGQVRFISVNVDSCADIANEYGIQSIPTVLFVNTDGKIDRKVGAMDEATFEAAVSNLITTPVNADSRPR